jgi:DNA-binding SARP family transcriptional activator
MIQLRVFGTLRLYNEQADQVGELIVQPKAIALLLYLVLARPRGFHQRDLLVALFWPELDQEHARASLRKAVHRIRQALGDDTVTSHGAESLAVTDALRCDATDFDDALADDRFREAVDLYEGELLPGFHLAGSTEFDRWLEQRRAYYRERAVSAAWQLVEHYAGDQEFTNASQVARLVARLASTDERMLRRVLTMLARLGDRAGAIDIYNKFADRLWKDYETRPSTETVRLVESIQANGVV